MRRLYRPVFALFALALPLPGSLHAAEEKVQFNRDIRPIFSDTCFQCHGPDEKKRKSGLRLDTRDTAVKPAESGAIAIVAGKPEESELVKRLEATDPDDIMPPAKLHKKTTPAQIATLKKWIAQGAEYQGHWAFIKPERPAVPKLAEIKLPNAAWKNGADGVSDWNVNPIDGFLLKNMASKGLTPSPEAAPETVIRRMSLDLTGLPPTPAEVDAFARAWKTNGSRAAVDKLADKLLASPRYGERMAVQWLDFARYADSNGFQSDSSRQMWHWRDWVIDAFNRNMPFDEFTLEQLAGDMIPNATRDQIVASGFQRNGRLNGEGGRIVEEWFAETIIDRVETTGMTWMGLTLGCARCHDHKFDPITQKEFYQFGAFFNSSDENGVLDDFGGSAGTRRGGNSRPVLALPTPEEEAQMAKLDAVVKTAQQHVAEAQKQLPQLEKDWEVKFREQLQGKTPAWQMLAAEAKSEGGATLTRLEDGTWLAGGKNPPNDTYTITAPIAPGDFSGLLLEAFPDPSLPGQSLGRNSNGNYVLTSVEAEISAPSLPQQLVADFTRAEADYEQKGYEVKLIVEENSPKRGKQKAKKGWAIDGNDPAKKVPRKAMFITSTPLTIPPDATIMIRLKHEAIANHNIGRFRVSATSLPPSVVKLNGGETPKDIRDTLNIESAKRTPAQRTALLKFYRDNTDNPASRAESALAEAKKKFDDFKNDLPNTMVMKELPQPREAFILIRGEYDKHGDKVERGLAAALPPLPAGASMDRRGLAQWLTAPENPLTARVWVNRAWEKFFGMGIVRTTENLGSQSEWPSNPELLDYLATEFVRLKWDMKAMQKLLVTSAAYRQSSKVTPDLQERDPENRLLARGPRFRLPAELLRDQALAVSGLLVEKLGGPSVRPYMPEGVWDETSRYGDMRNYKIDAGDGLYRRSLYTIWKRTASPPTMMIFDSPTREICTVKRSRTNTPLQALSLLNEVTFVESARALAQRMILEGGTTPEQRIAWAFQRATGRAPKPTELQVLASGLNTRLARYQADEASAQQLIAFGKSKPDAKADPKELAAYTLTANVLLNLDEVITRE
ncbi:MAG: PSD1 and planctomycete cytochrome C domain-containing protein [Chthoniobacter sp.]|uniref:PSD1 and planctomycete cytochrome C domain-containing protein n=1 Tax=Chthoniobacter sp. TaxID=2510640 RepID=UPI0032A20627